MTVSKLPKSGPALSEEVQTLKEHFRRLSAPFAKRAKELGILREEDVEKAIQQFRRRLR